MSLLAFIGAHWLWALVVLAVLVALALVPGLGPAVGRFLLGTELGRWLLLAGVLVLVGTWAWDARFEAGRAACASEQATANEGSRADAAEAAQGRDDTAAKIGAKAAAETGQRIEQGSKASAAAQERIGERIASNPPVAGCAGPDPAVMQDVHAADARVQAAADRLRRMGAAAAGAATPEGDDRLAPVGGQ